MHSSPTDSDRGTPAPITRRRVIVGGAALTGLTAASTVGVAQGQNPAPTAAPASSSGGRLRGQVAVVTGAARGIGRACAVLLAREGADIVALDIATNIKTVGYPLSSLQDLEETERLVKALGRRCLAFKSDTRNMKRMQEIVELTITRLGKVDIMVANAGILPRGGSLEKMTDEVWRDTIDVNLTGSANSVRAVVPHMVSRKSGRIIIIASDFGRHAAPERSAYCASKWGVIGFMKAAAMELAKSGITVNAVSPGFTRTGMAQNQEVYRALRPDLPNPTYADVAPVIMKQNAENNMLPIALLEPEDIANGVLYLVSNEARHVTGVALDITAGKNADYTA